MMEKRHTGLTVLKPIRVSGLAPRFSKRSGFSKGAAAMETTKTNAAQSFAFGHNIEKERNRSEGRRFSNEMNWFLTYWQRLLLSSQLQFLTLTCMSLYECIWVRRRRRGTQRNLGIWGQKDFCVIKFGSGIKAAKSPIFRKQSWGSEK